jgi:hypothetical protein
MIIQDFSIVLRSRYAENLVGQTHEPYHPASVERGWPSSKSRVWLANLGEGQRVPERATMGFIEKWGHF